MTENNEVIRDFLYMDEDRLYSLYSQLYKGIIEQIIEADTDSVSREDSQKGKGRTDKGKELKTLVSEVSERIERKILYDHMYNQLETKLQDAIIEPNDLSTENYQDVLNQGSIVKIQGRADIEDFIWIKEIMRDYSSIQYGLQFITQYKELANQDVFKKRASLKQSLQSSKKGRDKKDRNAIARIEKQLEEIQADLDDRLGLEESFIEYIERIEYLVDKFYPDNLDILVTQKEGDDGIVFRGILDRKWLRVEPHFLRALYGWSIESNVTLLGQLTFLPGRSVTEKTDLKHPQLGEMESNLEQESSGLRSGLRSMFIALGDLNDKFYKNEDKNIVEIIVKPLAIYQETRLSLKDKS